MDWAQILVVILASFLALFLLLSIILVIILIKLSRQIKTVAGSAERTVRQFEKTVTGLRSAASPLFFVSLLGKFIKKKQKASKHVAKK